MMTTTPSQNGPWIVMFKVYARLTQKWAAVAVTVTDREVLWTARHCSIWDIESGAWLRRIDSDIVALATKQGLGWNYCDPVAFMMFHGMELGVERKDTGNKDQITRALTEAPPLTMAGQRMDLPGEPRKTRQDVLNSL